jgi:mRNA interferase MazF
MKTNTQGKKAGFPLTLRIESAELPEPSWVKISQIRTLSVDRIGRRVADVSAEELDQVIEDLLIG